MVTVAEKLQFGAEATDWQERINMERMVRERQERARKYMKTAGIPALLLTRSENIRYVTGLWGPGWMPQLWYTLFFADDDPIVFHHAGWLPNMPSQNTRIKDWRIAHAWLEDAAGVEASRDEAKQFAADIYEELKKRGLLKEKLGVTGFDGIAREALTNAGIKQVEVRPLMQDIRAVKTVDEINCYKAVAAITEAGWYRVWETLKPGIKDVDVSRFCIDALYQAGAEYVPRIPVRSGPVTFDRGYSGTGRIIQTGDLVYLSVCDVQYMGYRSCTYRTLIAGRKPNQKEKDWYKMILEVIDGIISEIKPGKTTADAAKHFMPASTWGHKVEAEELTMEIGHGQGLFLYEPPIINRQWSFEHPQVFEPGQCIAIETRHGELGYGGVRLENMVVVTKDGCEIVDHTPREKILEPLANWG